MNKQLNTVTWILVMIVFAMVGLTAVFADGDRARQAVKTEFAAASPSATPPADEKGGRIAATCNTLRGCKALKDTCKSLEKHSFKATAADGSLGVCMDQTRNTSRGDLVLTNTDKTGAGKLYPNQPHKNPATDVGLAAPKKTIEATIYCSGVSICRKVKNICAVFHGTYTPSSGHSGSCEY